MEASETGIGSRWASHRITGCRPALFPVSANRALRTDSHRGVQRGREFGTSAASDYCPPLWRIRVRPAAWSIRTWRISRGRVAPAPPSKAFSGWLGRRGNSSLRGGDLRRRTNAELRLAHYYFVRCRNGLDQHCCLPERSRTADDPELDAGASHLHVSPGYAGRDGSRQRWLGCVGDKIRCADYNALFGSNSDRGIGEVAGFVADSGRASYGACRHQPISFVRARPFWGKTTFNLRRKPLCVV